MWLFTIWAIGSIVAFSIFWALLSEMNLVKFIGIVLLSALFSWIVPVGLLVFALIVLFIDWADNVEIKKKK